MGSALLLRLGLVLAAGIASAGCVSDYGATPFSCAKSSVCPAGYQCVADVCRREGHQQGRDARRESHWKPPVADGRAGDLYAKLGDLMPKLGDQKLAQEGPATFPDLPAGLTCAQINACYGTCKGIQTCYDTCFAKGSPDGKAKMAALEYCDEQAYKGTCAVACGFGQASCDSCIDKACAAQIAACFP